MSNMIKLNLIKILCLVVFLFITITSYFLLVKTSTKAVEFLPENIASELVLATDTNRIKYEKTWIEKSAEVPGLESINGMSYWMVSEQPRAKATFEFEGTSVSVILGVRSENGIVNVSIDGKWPMSISGFGMGRLSGGYLDFQSVNYREVMLPVMKPGKHKLVLTLTDKYDDEDFPTPKRRGPTPPGQVRLMGFRSGIFPFVVYSGVVKDTHGVRLGRANVHLNGTKGQYTTVTGDDGFFSLSGMASGEYTVTVNLAGHETVSASVKLVNRKNTTSRFRLPTGPQHPLYGKIYYPSSGVPSIVDAGKHVTIECDAKEDVSGWQASLDLPESSHIPLSVVPKYIGENQWLLTVVIPRETREELYDLSVKSTAGQHIQHRSVKVVSRYKTDFTFVVMDSIEEDYEMLRRIIDKLNILKPEFVLFTGDNIDFPINPEVAAVKFQKLMDELQKLRIPTFLVAGNHDLASCGEQRILPVWQQYIGKLYYSFQYGLSHFVGMNNANCQRIRMEVVDPDQIAFVKNAFASNKNEQLRFIFRHMVYTGLTPIVWPEWERKKCRVDMVLYGHYATNEIKYKDKTAYVQTSDVLEKGWYRTIHVRDGKVFQFDPPQQITEMAGISR